MRWIYRLLENSSCFFIYAYARESEELDGIIRYDIKQQVTELIKPCSNDRESSYAKEIALTHFQTVIKKNFPAECHVDCG